MDEYSQIYRGLHQGWKPPVGDWLRHRGFDVLVLSAEEYQPSSKSFPGVRVIHFPLGDDHHHWSGRELAELDRLSSWLAESVRRRKRVLVTCQMGLNRSGLIVAATLMKLVSATPLGAVSLIRRCRDPLALSNPTFVMLLQDEMSRWRTRLQSPSYGQR